MEKLHKILFNMFRLSVILLLCLGVWWNFNPGENPDGSERTFSDVTNQYVEIVGPKIEKTKNELKKLPEVQKTLLFGKSQEGLKSGDSWDADVLRPGQVWCKDYKNPFESTRQAVIIIAIKDGWVQTLNLDLLFPGETIYDNKRFWDAYALSSCPYRDWSYWKEIEL